MKVEEEVFTDSDSDSEDPTHAGLRLTSGKVDTAEFDRLRFKRHKLYEDKLAIFDQSETPIKYQKPQNVLIQQWIQKQVIGKVSSKIRAIESMNEQSGVRAIPETWQVDANIALGWLIGVRKMKIVVSSEIPELQDKLRQAVLQLRTQFPTWTITAKMGDPKAKIDHEEMHKTGY
jgi:hypothetical protein